MTLPINFICAYIYIYMFSSYLLTIMEEWDRQVGGYVIFIHMAAN